MAMGKISMQVQQCARAGRRRKLLEAENIKLQFETHNKHRIGDLFREHWQLNRPQPLDTGIFIKATLLHALQFHFASIFNLNSRANTVCPPPSPKYGFE